MVRDCAEFSVSAPRRPAGYRQKLLTLLLTGCLTAAAVQAAESVQISPDVVYGHKFGLALTMDVFTPEQPNGAGVVFIVSGGWYSVWSPPEQLQSRLQPLLDQGFTVFAVRHGSSPKFSIPEAVDDVRRSIRFIRHQADRFQVNPQRLGVFGISAGGHLSLVLGTTGDDGDPEATDPVAQTSSRVQAVVGLVAPTDLTIMVHEADDHLPAYDRFPALALDTAAARQHSPVFQVSSDDAATLLLAGDADDLVPVQHSRRIDKAFEQHGVPRKLVELKDAGHGFNAQQMQTAMQELTSWFEQHLQADEN